MAGNKKPLKKAPINSNKCPWCASRSYQEVEKLNFFQKIRYVGCKLYVCLKCNKKWAV
jgi:hypothetical protein